MKTPFSNPITTVHLNFPSLLALTVIVCLAAVQCLGADAGLPIATAAAVLVFCSRRRIATTWELLMHVHFLRTFEVIE